MAEARLCVRPLPAVNLDRAIDPKVHRFQAKGSYDGLTVFIPHPRFWIRGIARFIRKTHTKVKQLFSPMPWWMGVVAQAGALVWLLRSPSHSWIRNSRIANFLWDIDSRIPFTSRLSTQIRVGYLTFSFSMAVLLGLTFCHRMFLRLILSYTAWLEETRGPKSFKTILWAFLLKYLYIRGNVIPTLAYQTSLPKLPLPSLCDTMQRYLDSMQPILSAEEYEDIKRKAEAFQKNEGPKLQKYLWMKSWTSTNYVADWWLDVVYLRARDSLMINSNYYGLGLEVFPHTSNQVARASHLVEGLCKIMLELEYETLPRTMINGIVPLCMSQYKHVFSSTREPHGEIDRLVKYDVSQTSRHIVVMCRGRFYKLKIFCEKTKKLLSRVQLEGAIQGIVEDSVGGNVPEQKLGALTALRRTQWSEIRTDLLLRNRANRAALKTIESAAFVLNLEGIPVPYDDLVTCGRLGLHGKGYDRWFDKSFQLIVTTNGNAFVNGEHAWGDAPALGHVWDLCLAREIILQQKNLVYAVDGNLLVTESEKQGLKDKTLPVYHAERLSFDMTPELKVAVEAAALEAQQAIDRLQLHAGAFRKFGKDRAKLLGCSPDGFVQMAIQLAYYRDQKKFTQTYESAMTRLYRDGRTETIRSAGKESCDLVLAMENKKETDENRSKLLQKACGAHAKKIINAMTGRGVDRHLFALYVVAVGTSTDSPFLTSAIRRGWKLSTSQIPQNIAQEAWSQIPQQGETWPRPAGGFGPVADDGYGVCYTIHGNDTFYFHVTAFNGDADTNAKRMFDNIIKAVEELGALPPPPAPKKNK